MLEAVIKGFFVGLTLIISMGPIFFAVIETSIKRGFKYALCISLGTFASDVLYIILIYLGLSALLGNETFHLSLAIGGAIVLIIYGVINFYKKSDMHAADLHIKKVSYHTYLIKGFIINTLNPFVVFFWIATTGIASSMETEGDRLIFFTTILTVVLSADMLKAFLAGKIKHVITAKRMHWVNVLTGIAMIVCAVYLLWHTLVELR